MGGIAINREFISKNNTYDDMNKPKYIVVHETDNFSKGAGARGHAQAQFLGHLGTSVQYYCGSDGIYQAAEHTDGTYSVGREYGGDHAVHDADNRNTISVEICVNEDGDYAKARQNAIELVKHLMEVTGIPPERVIRHFDATGKHCPRKMMDNPELWQDFKREIAGQSMAAAGQGPDAAYTQRQFVIDVQKATGSNPDGIAGNETIGNTVTVSRNSNKRHAVVTPLERRLKALGHYTGEIEADKGEVPWFGKGMEEAVDSYQKNILGYRNPDGEVTAGDKTWKSLLGMI